MSSWVEGRVAGRRQWSDSLFSLQVEAPQLTFVAGQFARIALPAPPESKEPMIGRPYSFVNPPTAQPHEFYFIVLPDGPLSPRLATLTTGESVWLAPRANGFFSIAETAEAESLWCLSTGTGVGPFLSMLRTGDPWTKFGRVVLVHSVRYAEELTYRAEIAGIERDHPGAFDYVPMVSRGAHARCARRAHPQRDRRRPAGDARGLVADAGKRARDAVRESGDGGRRAEGARVPRHAASSAQGAGPHHARNVLVAPRAAGEGPPRSGDRRPWRVGARGRHSVVPYQHDVMRRPRMGSAGQRSRDHFGNVG